MRKIKLQPKIKAIPDDKMHIETGFDENIKTCIGMRKKENKYIAYLFNNDNSGDGDITNNIVSIDIIEKLTGYKFK